MKKLGQSFSIDKQHQISCSIGIAAGDHICTENDMTEMIKRADDLLYSIKTTTKRNLYVYENRFYLEKVTYIIDTLTQHGFDGLML